MKTPNMFHRAKYVLTSCALSLVILVSAKAEDAALPFLHVGDIYIIRYAALQPVNDKRAPEIVKIVESGGGQWYRVMYISDAEGSKSETWLNFAHVFAVTKASGPESVIVRLLGGTAEEKPK